MTFTPTNLKIAINSIIPIINLIQNLILHFISSCTYRFEAQEGERVRITVTNLRMGNRTDCKTASRVTGRVECESKGRSSARLQFLELAELASGGRSRLPKDCLCSQAEPHLPFVYTSISRALTLNFVVENMTFQDDYRSFGFEGTWEFIKRPVCVSRQTLSGPSGVLTFTAPSKTVTEVNLFINSVF